MIERRFPLYFACERRGIWLADDVENCVGRIHFPKRTYQEIDVLVCPDRAEKQKHFGTCRNRQNLSRFDCLLRIFITVVPMGNDRSRYAVQPGESRPSQRQSCSTQTDRAVDTRNELTPKPGFER